MYTYMYTYIPSHFKVFESHDLAHVIHDFAHVIALDMRQVMALCPCPTAMPCCNSMPSPLFLCPLWLL